MNDANINSCFADIFFMPIVCVHADLVQIRLGKLLTSEHTQTTQDQLAYNGAGVSSSRVIIGQLLNILSVLPFVFSIKELVGYRLLVLPQ